MQGRITLALGSIVVGAVAVAFYVNHFPVVALALALIAAGGFVYSLKLRSRARRRGKD